MHLDLREIRRPAGETRYGWTPFELNAEFNDVWWNQMSYLSDDRIYVQACIEGVEVARVELDEKFPGSLHRGAPHLGHLALEIQFIEVASSWRGRGIGSEVVRRLVAAHPDRQLLALSEDADDFWASLGWERYDYSDEGIRYRPLFVQPRTEDPGRPGRPDKRHPG